MRFSGHHTEAAKRSMGLKNSVHQKGSGNSQFGKCWIHSSIENKSLSIPKKELENWLSRGWIKGRISGV